MNISLIYKGFNPLKHLYTALFETPFKSIILAGFTLQAVILVVWGNTSWFNGLAYSFSVYFLFVLSRTVFSASTSHGFYEHSWSTFSMGGLGMLIGEYALGIQSHSHVQHNTTGQSLDELTQMLLSPMMLMMLLFCLPTCLIFCHRYLTRYTLFQLLVLHCSTSILMMLGMLFAMYLWQISQLSHHSSALLEHCLMLIFMVVFSSLSYFIICKNFTCNTG